VFEIALKAGSSRKMFASLDRAVPGAVFELTFNSQVRFAAAYNAPAKEFRNSGRRRLLSHAMAAA